MRVSKPMKRARARRPLPRRRRSKACCLQRRRSTGDGGSEWDQKEMTFTEHLRELRQRLLVCAIRTVFGIGMFCAVAGPATGSRSSRDVLSRRYAQRVRSGRRRVGRSSGSAIYIAIVVGLPVILYQIWMFVVPAIHPKTRKAGLQSTSRRRSCWPRPASRSRTSSSSRASSARCSHHELDRARRCSASSRRSISCCCCSSPSR